MTFPQSMYIKKGNIAYSNKAYYTALKYYEKAIDKNEALSNVTKINIADCYFYMNNYLKANSYFNQVITDSVEANILIRYGNTLQFIEQYQKALENFKTALDKNETEPNPLLNIYIESCKWSISNPDESIQYKVEKTEINTHGESFGIQFYKDGIIYSSVIEGKEDFTFEGFEYVDKKGQYFKDLYYSDYNNGIIGPPQLFSEEIQFDYHEGGVCFSRDYDTLYYTETVKTGNRSVLKIFQVDYENEEWSNKKELSFNNNEYSCAHPSISDDGQIMFFTSDMPGGHGGKDIYCVRKENGNWGKPQNLGNEVNTAGDEMFPFINTNNVLYFSSDGHIGYGGLDIYSSVFAEGKWTKVKNKRKPLNSSGDDFAIVVDPKGKNRLFISSNRAGDGNCDNIYSVQKIKLPTDKIKGTIKDTLTDKYLDSTYVYLIDRISGDTLAYAITNEKGEYELIVPELTEDLDDRDLVLVYKREGYENKQIDIVDKDFELEKPVFKNFDIGMKIKIEKEKVLQFHNIYFDLGSAELTDNAKIILDRIVGIMNENKTLEIELSAHTDSRAGNDYNLDLSEKRADNARNYLISGGIAGKRIIAKGYGEKMLLNHCMDGVECNEYEHSLNRRIEVKILKM